MIRSFSHKGLERFFTTGSKAGIQPAHAEKLRRQLSKLNAAKQPEEMSLPGWRLHKLSGDLDKHWSIWISGNWRLTFTFVGEDAHIVNYLDYH